MNKNLVKTVRAFTIIEVLTTLSITGALAAVAFPQFVRYSSNCYDSQAETLLRNVATAEEAYFTDNLSYVSCDQSDCHVLLDGLDPIPSEVRLTITSTGGTFTGTSKHIKGTGRVFDWGL